MVFRLLLSFLIMVGRVYLTKNNVVKIRVAHRFEIVFIRDKTNIVQLRIS